MIKVYSEQFTQNLTRVEVFQVSSQSSPVGFAMAAPSHMGDPAAPALVPGQHGP